MKVAFDVYLPYENITTLNKLLKSDKNLDFFLGRPPKAPRNKTDKVEIKIVIQNIQGTLHKEQVSKLISEFGTIVHNSDISNPPITDGINTYFRKNWVILAGAGVGITLEEILRNWHEIATGHLEIIPMFTYSSIVIIAIGLSLLKK